MSYSLTPLTRTFTTEDVLEFVRTNNGFSTVWKNWTELDFMRRLNWCMKNSGFGYATDGFKITGVCLASPMEDEKTLHIIGILCVQRGAFLLLVRKCKELFPGWTLTALRGDVKKRVVTYRRISQLEAVAKACSV